MKAAIYRKVRQGKVLEITDLEQPVPVELVMQFGATDAPRVSS
jgi:hypothetical protein